MRAGTSTNNPPTSTVWKIEYANLSMVQRESFGATNESFSCTNAHGFSSSSKKNHDYFAIGLLTVKVWVLLISGSSSYLVEAEEVLDGGGRVEHITLGCHHQHEAVEGLNMEERRLHSGSRPSTMSEKPKVHLKQQVSLREADSIDGGRLGGARGAGGIGGRRQRCREAPKHDAALTVPARAVLAILNGGCRRGNTRR